jgi:hypothetical protein
MTESFAPTDSMACSDYSEDDKAMLDATEILVDYYVGPIKITTMEWCENLSVFTLGMSDGTVRIYMLKVELPTTFQEDEDDDYGQE